MKKNKILNILGNIILVALGILIFPIILIACIEGETVQEIVNKTFEENKHEKLN